VECPPTTGKSERCPQGNGRKMFNNFSEKRRVRKKAVHSGNPPSGGRKHRSEKEAGENDNTEGKYQDAAPGGTSQLTLERSLKQVKIQPTALTRKDTHRRLDESRGSGETEAAPHRGEKGRPTPNDQIGAKSRKGSPGVEKNVSSVRGRAFVRKGGIKEEEGERRVRACQDALQKRKFRVEKRAVQVKKESYPA